VNLRIAKKVLKHQHRKREYKLVYSGQQCYFAAHRLFRYASRFELAKLALQALRLKPQNSFQVDDQVDLKYELLIGQEGRRETLTCSRAKVVPPPPINKPAYRRDGQVHNFNCLPYPGAKQNKITLARYQMRDQNHRARPRRSVADFAQDTPETQRNMPPENHRAYEMQRYLDETKKWLSETVCECGDPAGHHDDEPAGCWDCECSGYTLKSDSL
jgi:hypothetical protein